MEGYLLIADFICAFPYGCGAAAHPRGKLLVFRFSSPMALAPSLAPSNPTPKFRRRFRFSILVFSPEAGRQAGKAKKATDGWIERLSQRCSYLVTRVYDFETYLNWIYLNS